MMAGPHILAFSCVTFSMSLVRALASARCAGSGIAAMNDATLAFVCLVLFSAIGLLCIARFRFPLEADCVAIGIAQVELLHSIPRDLWRTHLDFLGQQMPIHGIDIRRAEVQADIVMSGDAALVGRRRP